MKTELILTARLLVLPSSCSDMKDPSVKNAARSLETHIAWFITESKSDPKTHAFEKRQITIPIVVHVIYNKAKPEENISEAQVQSRIGALNRPLKAMLNGYPRPFGLLMPDR